MASPTTLTVPNGSTDPTNPQPPSITTHLISPTALATSPYMPALFALINRTYNHAHNSYGRSLLPPVECSRLSTHEQLGEEIGEGGFTFTMLSAPNQQEDSKSEKGVIGTASAKPYTPPKPDDAKKGSISEATKLFKRQPGTEKELEEHARLPKWEILVTVVDPELQGRGLAKQLMDITVEEIRTRVARSGGGLSEEEGVGAQILLLLSTMQELNETYYAKRGWTTTGLRRFPPGTSGSRDGFGVVEMMKIVDA